MFPLCFVWKRGSVSIATTCTDPLDLFGDFDNQIRVFTGGCDNLTCIEGNDDERDGNCAGVRWLSSNSTLYYILVYGVENETGSFELEILSFNDECEDAVVPLQIDEIVLGSVALATSDGIAECGDAGESTEAGVWYSYLGTGNRVTATTCTNNYWLDGDFDSQITVLSGNSCDNLTCVDGNDDSDANPCDSESSVTWMANLDELYHILVHAYSSYSAEDTFAFVIRPFLNDQCETAIGPLVSGDVEHGSTTDASASVVEACTQATQSDAPGL